jgi:uncharacterized glyoxalase superfamily protein PhnB
MNAQPVPQGFHSITPYLTVKDADRLIVFLKEAFGAEDRGVFRDDAKRIMHGEFRIGDSMVELGQANQEWTPKVFSLHLYVPDADAVYRQAMAAGAKSIEEPVDQGYGDREAGIEDPAGNAWWIATHQKAGAGKYAPEGLHSVTVGLRVKDAASFIAFLEKAFGAREHMRHAADDGTVRYAQIWVGDSILEVSEANERFGATSSSLHYYAADSDSLYHAALAAGATSLTEPHNAHYGDRASGVVDAWGNNWYFATRLEEVTHAATPQ